MRKNLVWGEGITSFVTEGLIQYKSNSRVRVYIRFLINTTKGDHRRKNTESEKRKEKKKKRRKGRKNNGLPVRREEKKSGLTHQILLLTRLTSLLMFSIIRNLFVLQKRGNVKCFFSCDEKTLYLWEENICWTCEIDKIWYLM